MQRGVIADGAATPAVPWPMRFLSKFVLEILPAALASVIGGLVFAHYQFERAPAPARSPAPVATPASPDMVRLLRDEHTMIRRFLKAQEAVQEKQVARADAQDAAAVADVAHAAAPSRRAAVASSVAPNPAAPRRHVTVAYVAPASVIAPTTTGAPAAAALAASAAPLALNAATPAWPPAPPPPRRPFLVAQTLAVKDHVVGAALHAVMTIGGIPSWIGRRFGADERDGAEPPPAS